MPDDMVDLAEPLARDMSGFGPSLAGGGMMAPVNQTVIMATSREITAKKVAVAREPAVVLRTLAMMAASFGDTYVYSWPVKDRANGRSTILEGGTIKLANDLLMAYGNCSVDLDIQETPTHWLFKAWFMDYEKGVSTSRMFQQRKAQNVGMKDADRALDMVFQIGQSKAIRNVVLNALASFSNYTIEESKRNLLAKFADPENANKARTFITSVMDDNEISFGQVEAVIGRVRNDWTIRDLARIYTEMRGIKDGMTVASEVYPSVDKAAAIQAAKDAKKTEGDPVDDAGKKAAKGKTAKPKPEDKPKEEPEPAKDAKPQEEPGADEPEDDQSGADEIQGRNEPEPEQRRADAPKPAARKSLFGNNE